jgi:hypothetical protein
MDSSLSVVLEINPAQRPILILSDQLPSIFSGNKVRSTSTVSRFDLGLGASLKHRAWCSTWSTADL